jgi:hypothetical protein
MYFEVSKAHSYACVTFRRNSTCKTDTLTQCQEQ